MFEGGFGMAQIIVFAALYPAHAARHLQAEGIQIQMGTICNLQCFQRSKMDFPLYLARKKVLSRFLGRSKRLNCHLDSVFFRNIVFLAKSIRAYFGVLQAYYPVSRA